MTAFVLAGYGYCAKFLSKNLAQHAKSIYTISRHTPHSSANPIHHLTVDIGHTPVSINEDYILYYFIPPNPEHEQDKKLEFFLTHLSPKPQKIIYIGSSGIYGNHHGQVVNEQSPCYLHSLRQIQRQHAEQTLQEYSKAYDIPLALLRVAGIYGPNRLPLDAAKQQSPIVFAQQAPFINHIYVQDLANILNLLGQLITFHGILNIADGIPHPMGYLQQSCAALLNLPSAPYQDFETVFKKASLMKKEFMSQNKQLDITLLKQILRDTSISLTPLERGIEECINML